MLIDPSGTIRVCQRMSEVIADIDFYWQNKVDSQLEATISDNIIRSALREHFGGVYLFEGEGDFEFDSIQLALGVFQQKLAFMTPPSAPLRIYLDFYVDIVHSTNHAVFSIPDFRYLTFVLDKFPRLKPLLVPTDDEMTLIMNTSEVLKLDKNQHIAVSMAQYYIMNGLGENIFFYANEEDYLEAIIIYNE